MSKYAYIHKANTPSLLFLVAANGIVIFIAVHEQWAASTLLWTYWLQSVIIGIFQAAKMAALEKFSTASVQVNGHPVSPTPELKRKIVLFFLFHYGFFHFIYAIFLAQFFRDIAWPAILLSGSIFFANHALSFFMNLAETRTRTYNIGKMMLFPYLRIVPMHIVLVFGAMFLGNTPLLIFFLVLKTAADAFTHIIEHRRIKAPLR